MIACEVQVEGMAACVNAVRESLGRAAPLVSPRPSL
jgi:hypothetical protein